LAKSRFIVGGEHDDGSTENTEDTEEEICGEVRVTLRIQNAYVIDLLVENAVIVELN
jgi:hypothetical protein